MTDSPPGIGTSNIYSQTFNRWKSVYNQLTTTLDAFLAECLHLDSVLKQPGAQEWSQLEESLIYVDSTLGSLETRVSYTRDACIILGAVRNRSKSLVPFNRLPAEIVVHILSFTDIGCIIDHRLDSNETGRPPFPPTTILTVSKGLRDIVVSAPLLWTHIDLPIYEPRTSVCTHYVQSCLRYSGQLPLYVHVADDEDKETEYTSSSIISLLTPYAHRIVSISLYLDSVLTGEVVLGLFGNLASYQAREFYLDDCTIGRRNPGSSLYDEMFSGYLDGFLRPLQSVTIKGPFPPLQSVAFHGLTTLRLSPQNPPTPPPTLAQLTSVLTACPELRTLALFYCRFDTSSRASIEPVLLPKLELLDLRRAKIDELTALLSCIIPGSNTLTLSIWADPYIPENEMIKLHCFINQFNVKRLYLESYYYAHEERKPLQLLLQTFPALQELALCDYDLNFIPVEHPLSTDRFPRLHTLHVLPSCIIDSDNWHKLVGSSAIRVLYTTLGCPDRETIPKDFPLVKDHDCFSTYGGSNRDFEWPLDRS